MSITQQPPDNPSPLRWSSEVVAVFVGLAGSILIWVLTPYNNFLIRSSYIADSFMPPAALIPVLLLVMVWNPLAHRLVPALVLNRRQLAIAVGMMFVACTLPGQGLLRMLPYSLAKTPVYVRDSATIAKAYERMNLPPSLFPAPLGLGADTQVCDYFLTQLPPGKPVPWSAWLPPLLSWGALILPCYMMMIGLALILLPQWRRNERLAFPLLTVQQELITEPEPGRHFAPLFRKRAFWICSLGVLALYILYGQSQYYPDAVPAIPFDWNLERFFTEEPWRHLPGHIKNSRVYFIFLGIAFFMPNRIGFSVWFFVLAYGLYQMIAVNYVPPYYPATVREHRLGALLALTVAVLWLGRAHWAHVARCMVGRVADAEDRRNRASGWLFAAGCVGMFAWIVWIGVPPLWALFFVAFGFATSLIITRIVAETGMPFIRLDGGYQMTLVRIAPFHWLDPVTLWFSYIMAVLFQIASRVSCATLAIHALGLDECNTPQRQTRLAYVLLVLLTMGLVICGAVHVHMNYHFSMTLNGAEQPLSPWGCDRFDLASNAAAEWMTGRLAYDPFNMTGHILFGAGLASVLQWACLLTPRWPLHPVGLLMVNTFYSNNAWVSVFIGWLLKVLILRYGGVRVYRAARPAFLGLIMGEVFAAVVWCIEPAIRVMLDLPYIAIPIQPY